MASFCLSLCQIELLMTQLKGYLHKSMGVSVGVQYGVNVIPKSFYVHREEKRRMVLVSLLKMAKMLKLMLNNIVRLDTI